MAVIPIIMLNPYTWLIISAVVPAIYLLIYVYRKDHLEKEPTGLLLSLVILGIISTALAEFTESLGIALLPYLVEAGSKKYNLLLFFIVVGLSEEGFKYLLLKLRTWRNLNFNCQFDALVYAVFVSLGFALWENISYVLSYGFTTALVRAVTAIPGHTCFGVFMGIFYGVAKRCELCGDLKNAKLFKVLSLLVPVLLHGCYDYFASSESASGQWIFVGFIIVLFAASFKLVNYASGKDRYIQ